MEQSLNKEQIIATLHHRDPYLMVDEVTKLNKSKIIAFKTPRTDEFYIKGHFPGAHVVPGAMMQEMSTQTAGILLTKFYSPVENYHSEKTKGHALGVLKKINYSKFRNFAKPEVPIKMEVELINQLENLFEFKATLYQNDSWIMKNSFNLVNISDAPLLN